MTSQEDLKKIKYNLQYIRDLYDKMFPCAKEYIRFLRERINTIDNEEYNKDSYKNLKEIKTKGLKKLFNSEKRLKNDHGNFSAEDHWKDLKPKDIIFYKNLTENWLKTKTRRQRRIWNYFVLGVPKNSIAPRLKENSNFVIGTIKILQEDFLNLILKS